MKKIIAIKDFVVGNEVFIAGDEVKTKSYEAIVKLNEQGLIEPLTFKDLVLIKRELDNPEKFKKEVDE